MGKLTFYELVRESCIQVHGTGRERDFDAIELDELLTPSKLALAGRRDR
jgi:hypothetical protein